MDSKSKKIAKAMAGLAVAGLLSVSLMSVGERVAAQSATPTTGAAGGTATISVDGTGVVTIAPDTASITVGVSTQNASLAEAQAQATKQMQAIIDELKAQGIDSKDIQTSNFSVTVQQNFDSNGNPGAITGFQVSNQVSVTVRDISKVGAILDAVVAKGANTVYGVSFFVADPSAAEAQARKLAVQDAINQANELAGAAGAQVGEIISITSGSTSSPAPVAFNMATADAAKSSVPVEVGTTSISADVQITFELIP